MVTANQKLSIMAYKQRQLTNAIKCRAVPFKKGNSFSS